MMTATPTATTHAATARAAIAAILAGDPPDGAQPADLGEFWPAYAALSDAHAQGSTPAARLAWDALCNATPGLAALIAGEAPPANTFDTWRPLALDDVTKPDPRTPIVSGLLYRSTLSIPFGAPSSVKSFILADLALCVAMGTPWLLPDPGDAGAAALCEYPTRQGPVVWIDFDNGSYTTQERFYALKTAHGAKPGIPLSIYTMPSPWLDLSNPTHGDDFTAWLCNLPAQPALVVIDNLSYVSGGLSTNDDLMKNVMAALKHAAEASTAHIEAIHHERKSSGFKTRAGERLRGSSTIEAGIDLALLFERDGDAPTVTISATKNRILRSFPTLGVTLKTDHELDGVMTAARCWQVPVADGDADRVEGEVTAILTERGSVKKTDLAKLAAARAGVGINKARGIVGAMIDAGSLAAAIDDNARGKPVVVSLAL